MSDPCFPAGVCDPRLTAGLPADAPVTVALSGGADSVALLHMMWSAGVRPLSAVHVHHGIRGAEADRDAAFCAALCARLAVPLETLHADVPALAAARGVGLETAARDARYHAISAHLEASGSPLLLTGHHADDQLETVLQHLLRGSGLRGLCGIPVCRPLGSARVVRPLLQMTKAQILQYCRENALEYVTDSTNETGCCPRNRLRLEVLPVLAELWPSGAASAARCAASLAEDEAYLCDEAEQFLQREGKTPAVKALAALPRPILARVLRALLPEPPEAVHISALAELVTRGVPQSALCVPGARVVLKNGALTVETDRLPAHSYAVPVTRGEVRLPEGLGVAMLGSLADHPRLDLANVYKYSTRMDFSSAIINGRLVLRTRNEGERILCGGQHKLVRKLACMRAFSTRERARMPLLCDDDGVLAVPFGPLRDGAKNAPDTSLFLYFN